MNRYAVLIGSALALASIAACPAHVRAAERVPVTFQDKTITFTDILEQPSGRAISVDDPGLRTLLNDLGATVTYQQGGRYVLITTAEPVVVSFAIGDTQYDVGPVSEIAPFAPFTDSGHAYVPMNELLEGLDLMQKRSGAETVLQPQLAALDVQSTAGQTKIVAHAGIPLDARIVSQSGNHMVVAFDGVGTTLDPSRTLDGGPVRRIDVRTAGTVTHPTTYATLTLAPGVSHAQVGTDDQRDVTLAFAGGTPPQTAPAPAAAQQNTAEAPQAPQSPTAATSQNAQVTGVDVTTQNGQTVVRVAVDGSASYEWHRLRPPDNRWWLDIRSARLTAPSDQPQSGPVTDVRSHQENADTVRVALSLADFETVGVQPDDSGVTITIENQVADETAPRSGSGEIGSNAVANAQAPSAPNGWKFSPRGPQSTYVAPNPRLIVIDPGHGGSDFGAIRGDLVEKSLNLDMSQRLRDILVARGWQVIMTRDDDRDVYAPNDSAAEELQARDDIANRHGARLLISLHSNSFINDGPHGATVYYYKQDDFALAQSVDRRIADELGIYNNGVIKDKFYVINHADMPSTLVETAFLSNPDDRALLASAEWRQKMAQAIADGIGDYTGPPPPASGETNQ